MFSEWKEGHCSQRFGFDLVSDCGTDLSAPRLPSWQANFYANPPQSSILSERSSPSRSAILQRQVLRHCFPSSQAQVSIVTDFSPKPSFHLKDNRSRLLSPSFLAKLRIPEATLRQIKVDKILQNIYSVP